MLVTPLVLSLVEAGGPGNFSVSLGAQPLSPVTITVDSNNTNAAVPSTASLTFQPEAFNVPQIVTVTTIPNNVVDGLRIVQITLATTSSDAVFQNLTAPKVKVAVTDDETVRLRTCCCGRLWEGEAASAGSCGAARQFQSQGVGIQWQVRAHMHAVLPPLYQR